MLIAIRQRCDSCNLTRIVDIARIHNVYVSVGWDERRELNRGAALFPKPAMTPNVTLARIRRPALSH
jgi:hypothetical protein